MTIRKITVLIILAVFAVLPAAAQTSGEEQEFAENLEVSLAVIGPADALYSWWGHVSLIITNTETGASRYYDYGNFSFEQDSFMNNFIMGRLYFLKMASSPERQFKYNAFMNRDITVYTLNVKPADRLKLFRFLETEIKPENRIYLYDHFFDNCSTRIRDAMDMITDDEFSARFKAVPDRTIRTQARRYIHNPFWELLLSFAMNGSIDRPASHWDGMFLPDELGRGVELMTVTDINGKEIPLVNKKEVINTAEGRPATPEYPKPEWLLALAIGAVLGSVAFLLRERSRATAVFSMLVSFILAIPGSLLFFMACFTDHAFAYWNMNLLFVNPFLFITFAFSVRQLAGKNVSGKALRFCWLITAAGAVLSILLKVIPACRQDNIESILIVLPAAVIMSGLVKKKANVTT